MRLPDYHGEQALDLFADLLEPASEIMTDPLFVSYAREGNNIKAVKTAIKGHKKALIEILARLDGQEPEQYDVTLLTLPVKALELFNDPVIKDLFTQQGQKKADDTSGSATEPITENAP